MGDIEFPVVLEGHGHIAASSCFERGPGMAIK
jgi:hypothetical protein